MLLLVCWREFALADGKFPALEEGLEAEEFESAPLNQWRPTRGPLRVKFPLLLVLVLGSFVDSR